MREIDARTAISWVQSGKARVIDVRETWEFASQHIGGSQSLPLGQIGKQPLPKGDAEKLLLVCASGRRSGMACAALSDQEPDIYSLAGGIAGWKSAGGRVESAAGGSPFRRMAMLGAGLLVLAVLILIIRPGINR